jgi:hypothetical protein
VAGVVVMSAGTVIDRDEVKLQICLAAEQYIEARDELTAREDAHSELLHAGELQPGDMDVADKALTAAEEREALALARLRAKVAAW